MPFELARIFKKKNQNLTHARAIFHEHLLKRREKSKEKNIPKNLIRPFVEIGQIKQKLKELGLDLPPIPQKTNPIIEKSKYIGYINKHKRNSSCLKFINNTSLEKIYVNSVKHKKSVSFTDENKSIFLNNSFNTDFLYFFSFIILKEI